MMKLNVMPLGLLLAACVLAAPLQAQTGKPAAPDLVEVGASELVMTMRIDGELVFDTEGKVIEHRITTPNIQPALARFADDELARMRFEPVLIDGKPVNARTFARMTLAARTLDDGKYEVGIDNVLFFKGKFDASGAPRLDTEDDRSDRLLGAGWTIAKRPRDISYPIGLMHANIGGAVTVRVLLREDGTVENAFATQSALFNVRGKDKVLDRGRELLEQATLSAIRTWRFNPPAKRGAPDDPEWRSGNIPVFFYMDSTPSQRAGRWRSEQRGPRRMAAWEAARQQKRLVGVSDMEGDEGMVSPDPRIKRVQ